MFLFISFVLVACSLVDTIIVRNHSGNCSYATLYYSITRYVQKTILQKKIVKTLMVHKNKKIIKFHATEVENIIIRYATRVHNMPNGLLIEEFDALKDPELCETLNVQVVADFITITFYKQENENSILRRELIPSHAIEHIWVKG